MWKRLIGIGALALSACIPQVDAPYRAPAAPSPPPQTMPAPPPGPLQPSASNPEVQVPRTAASAWVARPVAADATSVATSTYIVKRGDTLRSIGNATGAGSEAIARANDLQPPFTIQPGQRLTIPGGRYHQVKSGETGIAIARAYGVEWSRIATANALAEPYILRTGQRVLIPGDAPGRSSAAERAAAFSLDIDDLVTGSQPAIAETARPAAPTASAKRVLAATTPVAPPADFRGGFAWPLTGRILARFGYSGVSGEKFNGIKIAAPLQTPVRAAADGVVAYAGSEIASLGGLVLVRHGDGWTSVYGHCAKLLVQRGQAVKRGQIIAYSGDTGFTDQPELHFELRKGRTPVDPLRQLPAL